MFPFSGTIGIFSSGNNSEYDTVSVHAVHHDVSIYHYRDLHGLQGRSPSSASISSHSINGLVLSGNWCALVSGPDTLYLPYL